ncbi:MAG: hypothetical protein LC102_00110 [Ignavibacteriales bacterium]|jgi:hypothetical protein|nr:MAG: hypothetical protein F9K26_11620 [Ignavibacteriaceae bacterium]MBW7872631.1 hypothetical protein [Ignavibacteria bacterium]MCZ2141815.1 hypothetical protein [Ignavibacteriales bacterium]OQY75607.1 MAG: hypothetical protein B6D45_05455 [Ignavibacteriales bacterium UTCHB3]MBV6444983.1 hypothetical protein [Ignavibacteriaceae bacterium]
MITDNNQNWNIKQGDYQRDYTSTNRFLKKQERIRRIRKIVLLALTVAVLGGLMYAALYLMKN